MTIQEKINALTPEQREKLSTVKTEQELDAFLAETGIEPTAEERAMLSEHLKAKNGELTDDELEAAAGGAWFEKCPYKGYYESAFPEPGCKGCRHLGLGIPGRYDADIMYTMTCYHFGRTERKTHDLWGLTK